MAGFTSIASTAMQAFSLANTIAKGIGDYRDDSGQAAYENMRRQSEIQLAGLQQKQTIERQQIALDKEKADQDRARKLRSAIATQRAAYGAGGVGSSSGSSQAYLLGLIGDAEEEGRTASAAADLRNRILDNTYNTQQSLNMLTLTQMKERNRLRGVTALYDNTVGLFSGMGNGVSVDSDGFYS